MKFTTREIGVQPEILKRRLGGELFAAVSFNEFFANNPNATFIPAGALIDGHADNSDSVGVLLNDVVAERPNGTIVKAFANISLTKMEESFGRPGHNFDAAHEATLRASLPLIVFER